MDKQNKQKNRTSLQQILYNQYKRNLKYIQNKFLKKFLRKLKFKELVYIIVRWEDLLFSFTGINSREATLWSEFKEN